MGEGTLNHSPPASSAQGPELITGDEDDPEKHQPISDSAHSESDTTTAESEG